MHRINHAWGHSDAKNAPRAPIYGNLWILVDFTGFGAGAGALGLAGWLSPSTGLMMHRINDAQD